MIIALFAATVFMTEATAAVPAAPTPTAAATPAATAPKKAELICRSEAVLGSRMPVRKCHTAEQAASDKADAREQLDRAQGANANNPH